MTNVDFQDKMMVGVPLAGMVQLIPFQMHSYLNLQNEISKVFLSMGNGSAATCCI